MAKFDFFISYSTADRERYISGLAAALERRGLSYWLDSVEIAWGDKIALRISDGLRDSRFFIVCLSRASLGRPWLETEQAAALGIQNAAGVKRVLPLILDSKEQVLLQYPILAGLQYREASEGMDTLAGELATLVETEGRVGALDVRAESAHTGLVFKVSVERRASVGFLTKMLTDGLGVRREADAGGFVPFKIRWVPVDARAESHWLSMGRDEQRRIWAAVMSEHGLRFSYSERDRLEDLMVYDGIVFHLFPVEDEEAMKLGPGDAKFGF